MKREYEFFNDVKMDFSEYEEVSFTEKECLTMKNNFKKTNKTYYSHKRMMWAAGLAACLAITSQTSFAKNLVEKIVSLGYSSIIVETGSDTDDMVIIPMPDELKGQIFDKDGNEFKELSSDMQEIYDKNGDQVVICSNETDGTMTYSLKKYSPTDPLADNVSIVTFDTIEDLEKNLSFDLKVPESLPDGFSISKICGLQDNDGNISTDYAILTYNSKNASFTIHERRDSEETKFAATLSDPQEMVFHGTTAVYTNSEFDATWDGTIISILGNNALTGDSLLEVARSLK